MFKNELRIVNCRIMQNQRASKEWYRYFLRRHLTGLARSPAFNKTNVNIFFDKLEKQMIWYKFTQERKHNLNETGLSTVHTPVRVIAAKGIKQVGSITSAERGVNVTMICCISAIGNCVPPLLCSRVCFLKNTCWRKLPQEVLVVQIQAGGPTVSLL